MKKKIELEERDIWRLRGCLMNEALKHKENSEDYKKRGYSGIALAEWSEGVAIMELREKISKALSVEGEKK